MNLNSSEHFKERSFPFAIGRYNHDHENTPPIHSHEFIELVYVIHGEGKHIFDGKSYDIYVNDVFIINPGEVHTFHIESGKQIEIVNCLFLSSLLEDTWLRKLGVSQSMDFLYVHPFLDTNERFHHRLNLQGGDSIRIQTLLAEMIEEFLANRTGYSTLIRLHLVELLILLSRIYSEKKLRISKTFQNEHSLLVRRICGYLERHYDQKLSVSSIADLFNISPRHFNRIFKQETGLTVVEMVQKIRIEKAKYFLEESNDKVISIAGKVGYDDPAFFTRLFKRSVGHSPGNYRKLVLQQ